MKYIVDGYNFDEGGSAEFYHILTHKDLGFKSFRNKNEANKARKRQKILSKFGLAPKVLGDICKLPMKLFNGDFCETNWGYITEKAHLVDEKIMKKRLRDIQKLVEKIQEKTGLKFWDCHYWNVGYIKRNNKAKLVCIDTGSESFIRDSNAWGMNQPGPKCNFCKKYQCDCSIY